MFIIGGDHQHSASRSTQQADQTLDCRLELQTKVCEDFTITEKAPARTVCRFKAPTSAFTFKNLSRHYAKLAATLITQKVGVKSGH